MERSFRQNRRGNGALALLALWVAVVGLILVSYALYLFWAGQTTPSTAVKQGSQISLTNYNQKAAVFYDNITVVTDPCPNGGNGGCTYDPTGSISSNNGPVAISFTGITNDTRTWAGSFGANGICSIQPCVFSMGSLGVNNALHPSAVYLLSFTSPSPGVVLTVTSSIGTD